MNPLLLATLQVCQAIGANVDTFIRLDQQGEFTRISITWPRSEGSTNYLEGFDHDEDALAVAVLADAMAAMKR